MYRNARNQGAGRYTKVLQQCQLLRHFSVGHRHHQLLGRGLIRQVRSSTDPRSRDSNLLRIVGRDLLKHKIFGNSATVRVTRVETYNVVAGDPAGRDEFGSRGVVNIPPCLVRSENPARSPKGGRWDAQILGSVSDQFLNLSPVSDPLSREILFGPRLSSNEFHEGAGRERNNL